MSSLGSMIRMRMDHFQLWLTIVSVFEPDVRKIYLYVHRNNLESIVYRSLSTSPKMLSEPIPSSYFGLL